MSEMIHVLNRLKDNSQLSAYAHFGAAERMSNFHLWFGVPTALISVGLGSILVADLQNVVPDFIKWTAGALSLVAAVLSTLQMFFNPKEGKSKHREIANKYLAINRQTEVVLSQYADKVFNLNKLAEHLETVNEEYNSTNNSAQDYPTNDKDWSRAKNKMVGAKKRANSSFELTPPSNAV